MKKAVIVSVPQEFSSLFEFDFHVEIDGLFLVLHFLSTLETIIMSERMILFAPSIQ